MTIAEAAQLRTEFKGDLQATEERILAAIRTDKAATEGRIDREIGHATRDRTAITATVTTCRTHCDDVRSSIYVRLVELEKQSAIVKILVPAVIGCGATIVTLFLKEVIAGLFG